MTNREAIVYASKHSFLELYELGKTDGVKEYLEGREIGEHVAAGFWEGYQAAVSEVLEYSFGMVDTEKFGLQHKLMDMKNGQMPAGGYIEKYVELNSLDEAGENETICASYPHPVKNVSGNKSEDCIIKADQDAQEGKCRLLVWRKVPNERI